MRDTIVATAAPPCDKAGSRRIVVAVSLVTLGLALAMFYDAQTIPDRIPFDALLSRAFGSSF